jgi:hypothetical protein
MDRVCVDSVDLRPLARDKLHGFGLGSPTSGEGSPVDSLAFHGWLLGRSTPVEAIEILQEGRLLQRLPVSLPRGDVVDAFPDVPAAASCGFSGAVGSLRLRSRFELLLRAVLEGGGHVPLATVKGRRQPIAAGGETGRRPLIVTTLGRTGSTWCLWLLQCHPQILAHDPFANDARVGSYWMSVLQTLSDPTSYMRQLYPGKVTGSDWWLGAEANTPSGLRDAGLSAWLGTGRVSDLAAMCRERIDDFYDFLAEAQGKEATFFVEKFQPGLVSTDLLRELYPDAAELVLVRDLRDMFCSILAFNRKRGYSAFGRGSVESDSEYVETVRRSGQALLAELRAPDRNTHLIRYEDLTERPVETLEPLLESIGVDPDGAAAMVERASVSVTGMDHHMTAESATASVGRWRRDLEPELAQRCDEVLSPLLAEFGYLAGLEPSAV